MLCIFVNLLRSYCFIYSGICVNQTSLQTMLSDEGFFFFFNLMQLEFKYLYEFDFTSY